MICVCAAFMRDMNSIVYYTAMCAFALVAVMYSAVDGEKFPHISRTLIVAALAAASIAAAYIAYYKTGLNEKFTDFDALRDYIRQSKWGIALFLALVVFQVVVLPVPAALTILLGVAIYGPTVSFILSTIGTMIGSLMSFAMGKIFGRRLCDWMFGKESTEKYAKLLNDKGRFLFIVMLLFPAFPDDMLCMIAGITDMSYLYFTVVCALTRPVMIGVTAYLGSGIIPFDAAGLPIWIALGCLMFVLFLVATRIKSLIELRR